MALRGSGSAPGSAGELVQGITAAGDHFHVTAPIELGSQVDVTLEPASDWFFTGQTGTLPKIRASIRATAELLGAGPFAVYFDRNTQLPVSRGMGSSTADIVAAARATAAALDLELSAEQEAQIAVSIESSAGLMHTGPVAFEQRTGTLIHQYQWTPKMDIVLTIPAETKVTGDVDLTGSAAHAAEYEELLETLLWASETKDAIAFAFAATKSAELNQKVNPNPLHRQLLNLCEDLGGDGIIVAHTGTVAGIIFLDATKKSLTRAAAMVAEEMPAQVSVRLVTIAGS